MGKQKLSPRAAAAKKKRDLAYAKTPRRTKMKAENQRKHRANPSADGKDYDHRTKSFKSVKYNRGNNGNGTKKEGPKKKK